MADNRRNEKKDFEVDYGVKVTAISEGRFKDIGIKKGYVILSVNGKKVKSAAEVRQFTNNESSLKSITGVQPDGMIFNYSFGN